MINNNELFAKTLSEHPPLYRIGDKVTTNSGVGYISGHVFKEREKIWKYTIQPVGLVNFYIDVERVDGKVS